MSTAVQHRGPDGEGFYVDGSFGVAHRRLSIIDLPPAGHQPMQTRDGRYTISYNGEIYNFRELRAALEGRGHQFHSQTDSEVALNAYAEWGPAALSRFNGMFAFAIWDSEKREVFLARDRYGIKPLYLCRTADAFIFASEVKAILAHPAPSARVNKAGLLEYFTFQNFLTSQTLFQGIEIMPAGTYAVVSAAQGETRFVRYWDYEMHQQADSATDEEYLEELDRLFRQAVTRQLVSDVDIGSYLSGGMDSGSITAVAGAQLKNLQTFTCGFDLHSASGLELSFDERKQAEYMSYCFKTEHYEMVLKAGDMERIMPTLAWHLEEPRVGQSYPNYYAAKLASRFVKVVLSGAGGDELFGGYPWRYYRAVTNANFDQYVDRYFDYWQRLMNADEIQSVFQPMWKEVGHVSTREIFRSIFENHDDRPNTPEDYVNYSMYFEAKTFLHGLLVVEDKLSMAHGLETRVPFLDNDLVDFAMRLPVRLKLKNLDEVVRINENDTGDKFAAYLQRTNDGKQLLRRAMQKYIPAQITEREKQGFSAPDASWFKGDSIDYVRRELFAGNAPIYELLDRTAVQSLISEHLEGHRNRRLLIWSLLNVNQWCKSFLN